MRNAYDDLWPTIEELQCPKAEKCFKIHWKQEQSVHDVPCSYVVAGRAVMSMEEDGRRCETAKYLNTNSLTLVHKCETMLKQDK